MSQEQQELQDAGEDEAEAHAQSVREVLIWSDFVHEQEENAQLSLWRLGFTPNYMRKQIFEVLHRLFDELGITAHTAYETLGDYDLLLRLWVPKAYLLEEVELRMRQELESCNRHGIYYIACHTVLHPSDNEGPHDITEALKIVRSLRDEELHAIGEYNRQQADTAPLIDEVHYGQREWADVPEIPRPAMVDELISAGALKSVPLSTRGVRFFVTFDPPRRPFARDMKKLTLDSLRTKCLEVTEKWRKLMPELDRPHVSIYSGNSTLMSDFIVMARAPHGCFHGFVRDLVMGIRDVDLIKALEIRPYTHVISDRMFAEFAETRRSSDDPEPIDEATVQSMEDESLEFKATLRENVRSFITVGRHERSAARVDDVIKAVCGLLNSPRPGRLIIGVLEVRGEIANRKDPIAYLDRLRDEFGYAYDPGDLLNVPNAIVGIEVEIGPDGFPDEDQYVRFLSEKLMSNLRPQPFPYVRIKLVPIGGRTVCVVSTRPADTWFEARVGKEREWKFFARAAASTHAYEGQDRLHYQRAYPRGSES